MCIFIVISRHSSSIPQIFFLLPKPFAVIVTLIAISHLLYILVIFLIRLKNIHTLLKSDKVEVRNSPLDRLATLSVKLLLCAKYGCVGVTGTSVALSTFAGLDSLLELGGHTPFFMQGVADIGNQILGVNNARTEYLNQKKLINNLTTVNHIFMELKETTKNLDSTFNNSGIFTKEELNELLTEIAKEAYSYKNEGIKLSNDLQTSIANSEILRELKSNK